MCSAASNNAFDGLEASALVRRFASKIADNAAGVPVLDVACGSGRNAFLLVSHGCAVVCVDNDLAPLQNRLRLSGRPSVASAMLSLRRLDLVEDPWPFAPRSVGGIINVHFLLPTLFPHFERSLCPGGYLLVESEPGCGGNYLHLPKPGEVRSALGRGFELEFYRERRVGPPGYSAVTVKLLARRIPDSCS